LSIRVSPDSQRGALPNKENRMWLVVKRIWHSSELWRVPFRDVVLLGYATTRYLARKTAYSGENTRNEEKAFSQLPSIEIRKLETC